MAGICIGSLGTLIFGSAAGFKQYRLNFLRNANGEVIILEEHCEPIIINEKTYYSKETRGKTVYKKFNFKLKKYIKSSSFENSQLLIKPIFNKRKELLEQIHNKFAQRLSYSEKVKNDGSGKKQEFKVLVPGNKYLVLVRDSHQEIMKNTTKEDQIDNAIFWRNMYTGLALASLFGGIASSYIKVPQILAFNPFRILS